MTSEVMISRLGGMNTEEASLTSEEARERVGARERDMRRVRKGMRGDGGSCIVVCEG